MPASRLQVRAENLSAWLLFLQTYLSYQDTVSLYSLLRHTQRYHRHVWNTFLWGMSSTLDLVLQYHQMSPLQLGAPWTALQSVACLLHWQVLLALAAHLSIKGRDELLLVGNKRVDHSRYIHCRHLASLNWAKTTARKVTFGDLVRLKRVWQYYEENKKGKQIDKNASSSRICYPMRIVQVSSGI